MKIQIVSDLHLDFRANREWLEKNPLIPKGDILLIAGDIVCDNCLELAEPFFTDIRKKFPLIIALKGNHEFYESVIDDSYASYKHQLADNHLLINNDVFVFDGIKFIVSTLWSNVPYYREHDVENGLNDYRYIYQIDSQGNKSKLRVSDTNRYHQKSLSFIEKELSQPFAGKTVLLTHHLPSYYCISEAHKDSAINAGFASNLNRLIRNNPQIVYWFCGHSHEFSYTTIHNTKVIRNPLGYVSYGEHNDFHRDYYVDV